MFAFCSLDADDLAIKHHIRRGEGHTHDPLHVLWGRETRKQRVSSPSASQVRRDVKDSRSGWG